MSNFVKTIALNEQSLSVGLLHKALSALGLHIAEIEKAQFKAGKDTLKKVRELQSKLNLNADESLLLNEETSEAIIKALEGKGLLSVGRSFTVSGKVLVNGKIKKNQKLVAFDLDLRGVSVYRTIDNFTDILKTGGFEILGTAISDIHGNFSVTFYEYFYRQAERKKADVVVYAIEGDSLDKLKIIGRSRMVNSEDYSDKGLVTGLDVIISKKDERTEYDALMEALTPFLAESNTNLEAISGSGDQLAFTASELDIDLSHLKIVASATNLISEKKEGFSLELLYGVGRQGIKLAWPIIFKKSVEELRDSITKSINERVIDNFSENEIESFLHAIKQHGSKQMLDDKGDGSKNSLNDMLKNALPRKEQRLSFVNALGDFKEADFHKFWNEYLPNQPEFKDKPELVSELLLTQQFTLLTGNHQALVSELQVKEGIKSVQQLMELDKEKWFKVIGKSGVPDFVEGKTDDEKARNYIDQMQGLLNAAFPTQRISVMVRNDELPIEKNSISKGISSFLSKTNFDFTHSRVHKFKKELKEISGKDYEETKAELMKIQRVFQVCTTPETMKPLMDNNLTSAHAIANIPRKSFIKMYSEALGGKHQAFAIHQRASHISTKAEMNAMHLLEYSHGYNPQSVMNSGEYERSMRLIKENMPNPSPDYIRLFGRADICECKHCRSVYSPAAYLVDLLRFLWRGEPNPDGKTPLDVLKDRRPDLLHLPLNCENTNTLIPYIDVANEVMEFYVAHDSINGFTGFDTGDTTEEELRANPQHVNLDAYRNLKDAKYPFTLPYHQPLDVIRTYGDYLKVSRYDVLKAVKPQPDTSTAKEIAAESLRLCEEEYAALTGEFFDSSADATQLHEFYGLATAADLENISNVLEFLNRTGIKYIDLVELIKTNFINPNQERYDYLEQIFSYASDDADTIYGWLVNTEAGTLSSSERAAIDDVLNAYNIDNGASLTFTDYEQWVTDYFSEFQSVITLYEPESKCDLENTQIRTIRSVREKLPDSGLDGSANGDWQRMHRFIRLWRKLGWSIHETDVMLAALGQQDISDETIGILESVFLIKSAAKLSIEQLAVLWGNIDTRGDKSLYKKLFLNRAVQRIDDVFRADAWGNYLHREVDEHGEAITLAKHKPAILSAFKITSDELDTIIEVAQVIDAGNPRMIDIDTDILNLQNLSTIYRHVVLAKALKMKVADLCKLIRLFGATPFSIWNYDSDQFVSISPKDTFDFYDMAGSIKSAGFKPSTVEYILQGTSNPNSSIALDREKALQTAKAIRNDLSVVDRDHPEPALLSTVFDTAANDLPPLLGVLAANLELTTDTLVSKMSLTIRPEVVSQFIELLEGKMEFESRANSNLAIEIPDDGSQSTIQQLVSDGFFGDADTATLFVKELSRKYSYIKGSGKLTSVGIMSDLERSVLKGLPNAEASFKGAIDDLYEAPEIFVSNHLEDIFVHHAVAEAELAGADMDVAAAEAWVTAKAVLLDHPAQTNSPTLEMKLAFVYAHFLPLLKYKLKKEAIIRHVASLTGLSDEIATLLVASDIDTYIDELSTEGFAADYFSNPNLAAPPVLHRTDGSIDFSWGPNAPDTLAPADNFSVRWSAYINAPASGEYTLIVDVEEPDESFRLHLDGVVILEKTGADAATSLEVVTQLNSAQMHSLVLEYSEASGNAGARLRWRSTSSTPEIIPSAVAYPADIFDGFAGKATGYHRAAKFVSGFELSAAEINHFLKYEADFDHIDFLSITADHWKRINDYTSLRKALPQAQAFLTDVFALANRGDPSPSVDQLIQRLHLATSWDVTALTYFVSTHFSLTIDDFKNEIAIRWLNELFQIIAKTGASAELLAEWGSASNDFDALNDTAQDIKNMLKARYENEDWLKLAGGISDKLREHQKQVLISYLLVQPEILAWGAKDADSLYEFFLIDVQMSACMDTSRVVQANAAVQMFVNRCLLNLEDKVSPDSIDKDRWEWMKNYRVWEANRKTFLYPENWLEPEWRMDRSEFFRELESYLVQNDITDRSVEQGLRNYLASLNEVANPDVCGMYRENYDDGELKCLHVFARTHNAPYKYFYRRWNEYGKWSPWEKVQVDLRSVEDGNKSGVHLVPVVWKKRLFLFWPEFIEKQWESEIDKTQSIKYTGENNPISSLEASKYWETHLAWSEYVDGKWNPKQISKEFISIDSSDVKHISKLGCQTSKSGSLIIGLNFNRWPAGYFQLTDINSKVIIYVPRGHIPPEFETPYESDYMKRAIPIPDDPNLFAFGSTLELSGDIYLKSTTVHKLLFSNNNGSYPELNPLQPFFFSSDQRTYFARTEPITIIEWIRNPDVFKPFLTEYEDVFRSAVPDYGPGDPLPVEMGISPFVSMESTHRTSIQPLMMGMSTISGDATSTRAMLKGGEVGVASNYQFEMMGYADIGMQPGGFQTVEGMRSGDILVRTTREAIGLEFHTFYHPYSSKFVERLNHGGIPMLMNCDTEDSSILDAITPDDGKTFENFYRPNFEHGLVKRHGDFSTPPDPRTAYMENVCFDVYGANSLYNWELFFHAPLYIATRLSKNGKYKEAMKWFHYIFDPTTDEVPASADDVSVYWKVLPFKTTPSESLDEWFRGLGPNSNPDTENSIIGEWRDNPFNPHLVASNRPLAHMKHVVIKYVENLISWGDSLFRQFTRESVYEAIQLYVVANHVLGPRPEFVPRRGNIKDETYSSLEPYLDDFSNALVALENIFPYSSDVSVSVPSPGNSLLGLGEALYFCIPANEKLLDYWDTVADRLFKIRHCQDIDGVERRLALFAPPIEPGALIQAASQGLSLGDILSDLSSPPPLYRFTYLIQKSNEFCADVKALGSALISVLEKKDAEELGRLRASHETNMLELMTAIKERQVLEARSNKENLLKARKTAEFRLQHYIDLLGNESIPPAPPPTIDAEVTSESSLPADINIQTIETDVDESLVNSDENGIKLIPKEKEEIDNLNTARDWQITAQATQLGASIAYIIPTVGADGTPLGVGADVKWGGTQLGNAIKAVGDGFDFVSGFYTHAASIAVKTASHIRREQDWTLQANLAAKEIIQLDKQITSADIRIQIAEKELENHKQQIENAKEVELFLQDKFTNQELYQWMKEQLFSVYKQSYNLAFDMAKKTEKAYKYELGDELASFIQYGYWDSSKQGLASGEKLQLALRQMEKSYLENNRRELELNKSVSLALLNPLALIELRETGKCYLSLPEELFDLDYQGHYFRRIKSIRLSIPCVSGPYTTVSCSLRLLKNSYRINTAMNSSGEYEHENDEGLWTDDDRFRSRNVPVTSIATSSAQNDTGMFEFNFRDERYLPFEGAGAISEWSIELSTEKELRQFDYSTISDVILHLSYTAKENGGIFKENAITYIKNFIMNSADLSDQPLMQLLSMKHEFPTEWHKFLHPNIAGDEQVLGITIGKKRFPFFAQDRGITVMKVDVFAKCAQPVDYHMLFSYTKADGTAITSSPITLPKNASYGGLNKATINENDAGLNLSEIDLSKEMTLKLKHSASADYASLGINPDEVEDVFFVAHYKLI